MKSILQPSKCLSLLPWESTTLKYGLVCLGILFLALIVLVLFWPEKKEAEKKWHSVYSCIGLIFVSAFTLFVALVLSFVVAATLGWGLALLAGISVVVGAISLVAGVIGAFIRVSARYLFLWGFLGMASFVSVLTLSLSASPC